MTGLIWLALLVVAASVLWRIRLEDQAVIPDGYRRRVMRSTFPARRWGWYVALGPAEPHPLNAIGSGFTFTKVGARLAAARCARRHLLRFMNGIEVPGGLIVTARLLSGSDARRVREIWTGRQEPRT